MILINPTALRKAKIVYNFGLSECNRVNHGHPVYNFGLSECNRVNHGHPIVYNFGLSECNRLTTDSQCIHFLHF